MAMNYEFERHIRASSEAQNEEGARALRALQDQFRALAATGTIPVLPREQPSTPVEAKAKRYDLVSLERMDFPEIMRFLRTETGLSQKEISSQSHMSRRTVVRIERSGQTSWRKVLDTCLALGLDPEGEEVALVKRKRAEFNEQKSSLKTATLE